MIKCEVSLVKNVDNVNKETRMNTKQQQQQYSKRIRLQLMQSYWAEFNGLNTKRKLKSVSAGWKTKDNLRDGF